MKNINEILFETRYPVGNDEYFSNLNDSEKENYFKFYELYSSFLIQFVMSKFDLKYYDDLIKNSANKFVRVREEGMDIYQFLSSEYLSYFYVRNNIYLEIQK